MSNYYHSRKRPIRYRDDMSDVEKNLMLASIASLDAAYASAADYDAANSAPDDGDAEESTLGYFNRYIAGDR